MPYYLLPFQAICIFSISLVLPLSPELSTDDFFLSQDFFNLFFFLFLNGGKKIFLYSTLITFCSQRTSLNPHPRLDWNFLYMIYLCICHTVLWQSVYFLKSEWLELKETTVPIPKTGKNGKIICLATGDAKWHSHSGK